MAELIWDRLGFTLILSFCTLLFTWVLACRSASIRPCGNIRSATISSPFIGFIGLAIPNFLLALVLMYVGVPYFGQSVGGLFSPQFQKRPGAGPSSLDLLTHLWIPMIVIGAAGTAALIRIMRANLLDELNKPYVTTARAKGLSGVAAAAQISGPRRAQPVRLDRRLDAAEPRSPAPIIVVGRAEPADRRAAAARALLSQDMYLAGAFILMLSLLTMIGTLISDILLALARSAHPAANSP